MNKTVQFVIGMACMCLVTIVKVDPTIPQAGYISGVVEDSNTGELLPGASVILVNTDIGAATDVEGRYNLEDVPVGTYTLRANFVGYRQLE